MQPVIGNRLRAWLASQIEREGGRHDEVAIYGGPAGDLGLCGGPSSMSWEIHGDLASLVLGGTGAILMELLHPSVMAGVHDSSSFWEHPEQRAKNTLGYVLKTTFGNTAAATRVIEMVKRVHAGVNGTRPDGVPYRALDPELIGWVHTSIPWAVMTAFDRYTRPLSRAEKDRYLKEQALIGRMGGADEIPESVDELEAYVARMRPKLAATEQLTDFLDFVSGESGRLKLSRAERLDRWIGLRAGMSIMPAWAQKLTGLRSSTSSARLLLQPSDAARARLVRWAMPELACKRLAVARATAAPAALAVTA